MHRVALLLALGVLGCTGAIDEPPVQRPGLPGEGPTTPEDRRCEIPGPGDAPLRRLTPPQYESMVDRLFPGVEISALQLPEVAASDNGYDNDATLAAPIEAALQQLHDAAVTVSEAAIADTSWLACDASDATCVNDTLLALAATAFRHPLDAEQTTVFESFVSAQVPEHGTETTLQLGIQAILESPEFLYVPESGSDADAPDGMRALTPAERAARLALFLWDEPADADLVARAEELGDSGIETLVDEMLADARIEAGFSRFASQWMPLRDGDWGGSYGRDPSLSGDQAFLDDLRESALRSLRHAFLEADIQELLTSRTAYVNDRLAPLFGVDPPGSTELVPIELPADQRAGILTHPAVLATAPADATFYSVYRGVMIMNQVLCIPPGLPQFDMIDVSEGAESGRTSRERLEQEHLDESCRGCHETIDGVGFAFGNFDAVGRWRTMEVGRPIDASGQVFGIEVNGAVDFANAVADREEVAYCMTRHLYAYATGRSSEDPRDLCQIQLLADELAESDGELRGLARAMALSNSFLYMLEEAE